jgi:UDP-2-acetamido-3-amino-2,3-dideoxy-glucuronate N-acetyltransferase
MMDKKYFVHESSYVDDGVEIGENTKIWHFSHVQKGSRIGSNCSLGQNVNVGNNVTIGNNVKIQNNVSIYEGVELGDYVFCGPSMVFTNIMNPRSEFPQRGSEFYLQTPVGKSASLGANSTIVCGHSVGKYAFVGAGSVVTKNVPDYAMVVGNPARLHGWMCACGNKLSLTRDPHTKETATCSKCGRGYVKDGLIVEQSK